MAENSDRTENRLRFTHGARLGLVSASVIVLMAIGLAVWWYRSSLMQWGAQQYLARTALITPKLSGLRLDFKQAELAEMEFGVETGVGQLSARLENIKADYDLSTRKVSTVSVNHARLQLTPQAADQAGVKQAGSSAPLALPLDKLTLENLDLTIHTPWGLSRFAGRGELKRETADAFQVIFQDANQSIRFEFGPGLSSVGVTVARMTHGTILEFHAEHLDQPRQQARLHAGMAFLAEWLNTSVLAPETLKAKMAGAGLPGLALGLQGMQLELNAESLDHFDTLQGQAALTRNHQQLAGIDLSLTKPPRALDLAGNLDMAASEAFELVKPLSKGITQSLMISAGKLQGAMKLHWQFDNHSSGTAHLSATNLGLTLGAMQVETGNIELELADLAHGSMLLSVDAGKLKFGKAIAAGNLLIKAHGLERVLTLDQAVLSIFGGAMELLPGNMDLERYPIPLTVRLKQVDLSQLLASLQYPDISGTGTLNGELPIKLTADTVELQDGLLNGTSPGVIRYQGPAADNENLAFAALRNLAYHTLQARVNYQPNGDYRLGLRLEGSNPLVLSGHPLVFNLNIGGHLPELLRRGIATGDFERVIMQQANTGQTSVKITAKPGANAPSGNQQPKPPKANRSSQ